MSTYPQTRDALHRIAEEVVSPARVRATGNEIALEVTPDGFGTPPFPDGGRVRVEKTQLVFEGGGGGQAGARESRGWCGGRGGGRGGGSRWTSTPPTRRASRASSASPGTRSRRC